MPEAEFSRAGLMHGPVSTLSGAAGDGVRNDTAAIQKAIDALPAGGTLAIPPGHYLCGGLRLKSRMTLKLAAGAELVASDRIGDHADLTFCQHREKALSRAMIFGYQLEDVTIEGPGCINGSGHCFWDYDGERTGDPFDLLTDGWKVYRPHAVRPVTLYMQSCRNVVLKNFIITDAAAYTVWILGCDRVLIDTLTVRNHRFGPNTDVLDIDCSADVLVRGCDLEAGDDAIALKSDIALLGIDKPCERITVERCRLVSSTCAVRVGYEGDGAIRDCDFHDLLIEDSRNGLNFLSLVPEAQRFGIRHGTKIENMRFSRTVMKSVGRPFFLWSGSVLPEEQQAYSAHISGITFEDMTIDSVDASFFGGDDVSDVTLRKIRIVLRDNHCRHGRSEVQKPTHWSRGFVSDPLTCLNTVLNQSDVTVTCE